MKIKRYVYIKLISIIICVTMLLQNVAWADPELCARKSSGQNLQIPTMFQNINAKQPEKILELCMKCVLSTIDDLEHYHYHLTPTVNGVKLDLEFDRQYPEPRNDNVSIIPCSCSTGRSTRFFEAVIINQRMEYLRRPSGIERERITSLDKYRNKIMPWLTYGSERAMTLGEACIKQKEYDELRRFMRYWASRIKQDGDAELPLQIISYVEKLDINFEDIARSNEHNARLLYLLYKAYDNCFTRSLRTLKPLTDKELETLSRTWRSIITEYEVYMCFSDVAYDAYARHRRFTERMTELNLKFIASLISMIKAKENGVLDSEYVNKYKTVKINRSLYDWLKGSIPGTINRLLFPKTERAASLSRPQIIEQLREAVVKKYGDSDEELQCVISIKENDLGGDIAHVLRINRMNLHRAVCLAFPDLVINKYNRKLARWMFIENDPGRWDDTDDQRSAVEALVAFYHKDNDKWRKSLVEEGILDASELPEPDELISSRKELKAYHFTGQRSGKPRKRTYIRHVRSLYNDVFASSLRLMENVLFKHRRTLGSYTDNELTALVGLAEKKHMAHEHNAVMNRDIFEIRQFGLTALVHIDSALYVFMTKNKWDLLHELLPYRKVRHRQGAVVMYRRKRISNRPLTSMCESEIVRLLMDAHDEHIRREMVAVEQEKIRHPRPFNSTRLREIDQSLLEHMRNKRPNLFNMWFKDKGAEDGDVATAQTALVEEPGTDEELMFTIKAPAFIDIITSNADGFNLAAEIESCDADALLNAEKAVKVIRRTCPILVFSVIDEFHFVRNLKGGSLAYQRGRKAYFDYRILENESLLFDQVEHEGMEAMLKILEPVPAVRHVVALVFNIMRFINPTHDRTGPDNPDKKRKYQTDLLEGLEKDPKIDQSGDVLALYSAAGRLFKDGLGALGEKMDQLLNEILITMGRDERFKGAAAYIGHHRGVVKGQIEKYIQKISGLRLHQKKIMSTMHRIFGELQRHDIFSLGCKLISGDHSLIEEAKGEIDKHIRLSVNGRASPFLEFVRESVIGMLRMFTGSIAGHIVATLPSDLTEKIMHIGDSVALRLLYLDQARRHLRNLAQVHRISLDTIIRYLQPLIAFGKVSYEQDQGFTYSHVPTADASTDEWAGEFAVRWAKVLKENAYRTDESEIGEALKPLIKEALLARKLNSLIVPRELLGENLPVRAFLQVLYDFGFRPTIPDNIIIDHLSIEYTGQEDTGQGIIYGTVNIQKPEALVGGIAIWVKHSERMERFIGEAAFRKAFTRRVKKMVGKRVVKTGQYAVLHKKARPYLKDKFIMCAGVSLDLMDEAAVRKCVDEVFIDEIGDDRKEEIVRDFLGGEEKGIDRDELKDILLHPDSGRAGKRDEAAGTGKDGEVVEDVKQLKEAMRKAYHNLAIYFMRENAALNFHGIAVGKSKGRAHYSAFQVYDEFGMDPCNSDDKKADFWETSGIKDIKYAKKGSEKTPPAICIKTNNVYEEGHKESDSDEFVVFFRKEAGSLEVIEDAALIRKYVDFEDCADMNGDEWEKWRRNEIIRLAREGMLLISGLFQFKDAEKAVAFAGYCGNNDKEKRELMQYMYGTHHRTWDVIRNGLMGFITQEGEPSREIELGRKNDEGGAPTMAIDEIAVMRDFGYEQVVDPDEVADLLQREAVRHDDGAKVKVIEKVSVIPGEETKWGPRPSCLEVMLTDEGSFHLEQDVVRDRVYVYYFDKDCRSLLAESKRYERIAERLAEYENDEGHSSDPWDDVIEDIRAGRAIANINFVLVDTDKYQEQMNIYASTEDKRTVESALYRRVVPRGKRHKWHVLPLLGEPCHKIKVNKGQWQEILDDIKRKRYDAVECGYQLDAVRMDTGETISLPVSVSIGYSIPTLEAVENMKPDSYTLIISMDTSPLGWGTAILMHRPKERYLSTTNYRNRLKVARVETDRLLTGTTEYREVKARIESRLVQANGNGGRRKGLGIQKITADYISAIKKDIKRIVPRKEDLDHVCSTIEETAHILLANRSGEVDAASFGRFTRVVDAIIAQAVFDSYLSFDEYICRVKQEILTSDDEVIRQVDMPFGERERKISELEEGAFADEMSKKNEIISKQRQRIVDLLPVFEDNMELLEGCALVRMMIMVNDDGHFVIGIKEFDNLLAALTRDAAAWRQAYRDACAYAYASEGPNYWVCGASLGVLRPEGAEKSAVKIIQNEHFRKADSLTDRSSKKQDLGKILDRLRRDNNIPDRVKKAIDKRLFGAIGLSVKDLSKGRKRQSVNQDMIVACIAIELIPFVNEVKEEIADIALVLDVITTDKDMCEYFDNVDDDGRRFLNDLPTKDDETRKIREGLANIKKNRDPIRNKMVDDIRGVLTFRQKVLEEKVRPPIVAILAMIKKLGYDVDDAGEHENLIRTKTIKSEEDLIDAARGREEVRIGMRYPALRKRKEAVAMAMAEARREGWDEKRIGECLRACGDMGDRIDRCMAPYNTAIEHKPPSVLAAIAKSALHRLPKHPEIMEQRAVMGEAVDIFNNEVRGLQNDLVFTMFQYLKDALLETRPILKDREEMVSAIYAEMGMGEWSSVEVARCLDLSSSLIERMNGVRDDYYMEEKQGHTNALAIAMIGIHRRIAYIRDQMDASKQELGPARKYLIDELDDIEKESFKAGPDDTAEMRLVKLSVKETEAVREEIKGIFDGLKRYKCKGKNDGDSLIRFLSDSNVNKAIEGNQIGILRDLLRQEFILLEKAVDTISEKAPSLHQDMDMLRSWPVRGAKYAFFEKGIEVEAHPLVLRINGILCEIDGENPYRRDYASYWRLIRDDIVGSKKEALEKAKGKNEKIASLEKDKRIVKEYLDGYAVRIDEQQRRPNLSELAGMEEALRRFPEDMYARVQNLYDAGDEACNALTRRRKEMHARVNQMKDSLISTYWEGYLKGLEEYVLQTEELEDPTIDGLFDRFARDKIGISIKGRLRSKCYLDFCDALAGIEYGYMEDNDVRSVLIQARLMIHPDEVHQTGPGSWTFAVGDETAIELPDSTMVVVADIERSGDSKAIRFEVVEGSGEVKEVENRSFIAGRHRITLHPFQTARQRKYMNEGGFIAIGTIEETSIASIETVEGADETDEDAGAVELDAAERSRVRIPELSRMIDGLSLDMLGVGKMYDALCDISAKINDIRMDIRMNIASIHEDDADYLEQELGTLEKIVDIEVREVKRRSDELKQQHVAEIEEIIRGLPNPAFLKLDKPIRALLVAKAGQLRPDIERASERVMRAFQRVKEKLIANDKERYMEALAHKFTQGTGAPAGMIGWLWRPLIKRGKQNLAARLSFGIEEMIFSWVLIDVIECMLKYFEIWDPMCLWILYALSVVIYGLAHREIFVWDGNKVAPLDDPDSSDRGVLMCFGALFRIFYLFPGTRKYAYIWALISHAVYNNFIAKRIGGHLGMISSATETGSKLRLISVDSGETEEIVLDGIEGFPKELRKRFETSLRTRRIEDNSIGVQVLAYTKEEYEYLLDLGLTPDMTVEEYHIRAKEPIKDRLRLRKVESIGAKHQKLFIELNEPIKTDTGEKINTVVIGLNKGYSEYSADFRAMFAPGDKKIDINRTCNSIMQYLSRDWLDVVEWPILFKIHDESEKENFIKKLNEKGLQNTEVSLWGKWIASEEEISMRRGEHETCPATPEGLIILFNDAVEELQNIMSDRSYRRISEDPLVKADLRKMHAQLIRHAQPGLYEKYMRQFGFEVKEEVETVLDVIESVEALHGEMERLDPSKYSANAFLKYWREMSRIRAMSFLLSSWYSQVNTEETNSHSASAEFNCLAIKLEMLYKTMFSKGHALRALDIEESKKTIPKAIQTQEFSGHGESRYIFNLTAIEPLHEDLAYLRGVFGEGIPETKKTLGRIYDELYNELHELLEKLRINIHRVLGMGLSLEWQLFLDRLSCVIKSEYNHQWETQNQSFMPDHKLFHMKLIMHAEYADRHINVTEANMYSYFNRLDVPSEHPEMPQGWTYFSHNTNLTKKGWDYDPDILDNSRKFIAGRRRESPLMMYSKLQQERPYSNYDIQADMERYRRPDKSRESGIAPKGSATPSREEYDRKNRPVEIRVIVPEQGAGKDIPVLEQLIDKYYGRDKFQQEAMLFSNKRMTKVAHVEEDGRDIFYYIPDEILEYYVDTCLGNEITVTVREDLMPELVEIIDEDNADRLVFRNLTKDDELAKNMIEKMLTMMVEGEELILLFDNELGMGQEASPMRLIRRLRELKREPQFKRLLKNLQIIETTRARMHNKVWKHIGNNKARIMIFANKNGRDELKNVEKMTKPSMYYIDEKGFPSGARYPLIEIVTMAMVRQADGIDDIEELKGLLVKAGVSLEKINIEDVVMSYNSGAVIIKLLPDAEAFDKGKILGEYADIWKFLISA